MPAHYELVCADCGRASQPVGGSANLNADRVGQIINRLTFVKFNSDGKAFLYKVRTLYATW